MLVLGRHREKAAVSDKLCVFELALEVVGQRREDGVVVRRADDPRMLHVRGVQIVDETQCAGHKLAQVKRLDARGWRSCSDTRAQRGLHIDRECQGRLFDQLAEAKCLVRLA